MGRAGARPWLGVRSLTEAGQSWPEDFGHRGDRPGRL